MGTVRDRVLASVWIAVLALPVVGQVARNRTSTVEMGNGAHGARLPYTAEFKITRVQLLANGNTITHESTEVKALDSQGRTMTSTTTIPLSEDQTPTTRGNVFDPVARTNTNWNSMSRQATVMAMRTPGQGRAPCATAVAGSEPMTPRVQREMPTSEDLGTETIQGVEARGRRTSTVTPAGEIGNEAPLVRTIEVWTAILPGLRGLVVRQITDDPQSGKTTRELMNLSQTEPDPSAFQPPEGYEIVMKDMPEVSCPAVERIEPAPPAPAQ
jgi:hypothetical protein